MVGPSVGTAKASPVNRAQRDKRVGIEIGSSGAQHLETDSSRVTTFEFQICAEHSAKERIPRCRDIEDKSLVSRST